MGSERRGERDSVVDHTKHSIPTRFLYHPYHPHHLDACTHSLQLDS
jgi:hypothetical protein